MGKTFTARVQTAGDHWLEFRDPVLVLQADTPEAVHRTLVDVEQLTRDRGLHAVGFVTYEAGAAYGLPVSASPGDLPLAWFALCEPSGVLRVERQKRTADYRIGTLTPSVERRQFAEAFARIRHHLADGNSYQANYTFRLSGAFDGDAASFFADLCDAQRGQHAAFIDLGRFAVCSASPELFFEIQGLDIVARPMKGTARRGRTLDDDRAAGLELATSAKNQAENVMVVDMVRNDLGRIADVGSVQVSELFTVERYPNVWQMTSVVRARSLAPLADIFSALHPSASVTGAPKVATMELLRALEAGPRGVYTGAVGHVPPDGMASFNVAIRTAVIDRTTSTLTFGIGSGIVWDSDADAEYDECLLKGAVLGQRPVDFELLETLRWSPGDGFVLLERHLQRLQDAAEYFSMPMPSAEVDAALAAAVAEAAGPLRVRLLVSRQGQVRVEQQPFVPAAGVVRAALALAPIDSSDVFLFHKTTNRRVYDDARASVAGVDEVLLWNAGGEVTEGTTANLVAEIDGVRVTPPIASGLLAGTYRAMLLDTGRVTERVLTIDDLRHATALWLVNSVQGERPVELVG